MAITTKMTEVQNGITFGYSDTCSTLFSRGDLTASELARFSWCRWEDRYMDCIGVTDINISQNQGSAVTNLLSYFQNNGWDTKTKYVDGLIHESKPYAFNILMYGRNGDLCLTSDNASNYRVVTSCSDFQKLYVKVDRYDTSRTRNVQIPTSRTITENNLLWVAEGVFNTDNNSYTQWITVWTVLVIDENTFFITRGMAFPNRTPCLYDGVVGSAQGNIRPSNYLILNPTPANDIWRYNYGDITTYNKSKHLLRWYKNGISSIEDTTWSGNQQYGCWDVDDDVCVYASGFRGAYNYTYALKSEDAVKNAIAYTGLRWRYANGDTEHIYTPIIDGDGYITGYSTDPDAETKLNDIIDVTGNNISPVPPIPPTPTPGEDAEPETFGWGGNEVAGMVRYYLLSQSEMEELQAFMSDASWRMDYRNCIIGIYVVPNGGLFFDAAVPTTLKFRIGHNETGEGVIPQDQELDTGISCMRITGVVNNDNAVIEIPRINDNFLDFEPYSKYMVYVPFCGVIPLPDYVAGKEIKVTIYPDVPTCTCTAVVSSEGRKIATAKGAYGSQLPVTSDGDGLKAASVINSIGSFIMGAGEVALGIGTGMVPLAIAGGAQMVGSGLQTDLQLGQAFGYSIGASGDTSFFGAGNRCEYYVTYSKWNNPDDDEESNIYGHTYGFVCNKRGLLKDFDGFTVCDNPHVYGFSCTSDEKDEIERLLREGIIIHMSEE